MLSSHMLVSSIQIIVLIDLDQITPSGLRVTVRVRFRVSVRVRVSVGFSVRVRVRVRVRAGENWLSDSNYTRHSL